MPIYLRTTINTINLRLSGRPVKKIMKKMGKQKMTEAEFKKSIAGGLTVGVIEDVMDGIAQYVNIGVNHFIFHFLHLDSSVIKEFSKLIKKSK